MHPKLLLLAVAAFALFAQKPAPEQPVNRNIPRFVEVNVIVRDKNGPVAGLTQKDFSVSDKGKEQKIVSFIASDSRLAGDSRASSLPRGVFANRPALSAPPSGVTVLLVDALNTRDAVQSYLRTQLLKALPEIGLRDRVVLCVLGSRLRILNDFRARFGEGGSVEEWLVESSVAGGMNIDNQLTNTTDALTAIAADIRHFTGRKNLVWLAGLYPVSVDHYGAEGPPGFESSVTNISAAATGINSPTADPTQIDRMVFQKIFSPAMQALNFAGVAVYAVDAGGLVDAASPTGASATARTPASIRGNNSTMTPRGTDALRILAADSGGRVSEASNDIQASILQAVHDAEVTYTLGYYADPKSLDSRFHQLKVQVGRKDAELHYREGYVALPETRTVEAQRTDAIRQALVSPIPVDGIGLMAAYQKVDQPKPVLRTTVTISAADLELQQNADQVSGELEITLSPRSADGKDRGTVRQALALKLTQVQYQTVLKEGLPFSTTLDLSGDVAELRAVVCDRKSGRLGSLIIPVK